MEDFEEKIKATYKLSEKDEQIFNLEKNGINMIK